MRSLHWPGLHRGLRQASAALTVTGCLVLAACGGGPAAKPAGQNTAASASAPGEPVSGAAAVAAITANWKTVFNGKAPLDRRLALVQNGDQLTAFIQAQAKTPFGQAAMGSSATVSSVIISSAQATVHWNLLLLGTPLLKDQVGSAVYLNGVWKVSIASFCGLAYLEYPKGSPKLPAACRS